MFFRERGFAGATVVRGMAGFGASARLHTGRVLRLSTDLPVIVEVVEEQDRIQEVLPSSIPCRWRPGHVGKGPSHSIPIGRWFGVTVLYLSYDGALDPLGQSQVVPYDALGQLRETGKSP